MYKKYATDVKSKFGQAIVTQSCNPGVLQHTDCSQKCERVRKRREVRTWAEVDTRESKDALTQHGKALCDSKLIWCTVFEILTSEFAVHFESDKPGMRNSGERATGMYATVCAFSPVAAFYPHPTDSRWRC